MPEQTLRTIEEQTAAIRDRLAQSSLPGRSPAEGQTEDPEVYYLREDSAPRLIFSGEDLLEIRLPAGTRVIYPRVPMRALNDVRGGVRHALLNPEGMQPLPELLRPGMKVTIAVDDISLPLPQMKPPDLRQTITEAVLDFLDQAGVTDIHIIIATAFHRRMKPSELRRTLGAKIFGRFFPDRLYNHDGENKAEMKWLGHTERGEVVEINRRAAESDLLIYVNINFVPMNGGHKSVSTGLAGYRSLREHHDPEVIAACNSYMDPPRSALAEANVRMNSLVEEKLRVFHIESTINSEMFAPALSFLSKNEDDFSVADRAKKDALVALLGRLRPAVKRRMFQRIPAQYGCTSVFAGAVERVHNRILETSSRQYTVRVREQADVLVVGIPFICPYSVNSILNPLLVQVMALGYIYHLYEGGIPLLRDGGTLLVCHPCRDEWDPRIHPSYIEFFHRLLPETTNSVELQRKYELEFATNPEYIRQYREGYAYHGVHPFYMWYWGEAGRRRVGRVIAVGAVDKHVPTRMGWENAANIEQALEMARNTQKNPRVTMLHAPPMLTTRCMVDPSETGGGS